MPVEPVTAARTLILVRHCETALNVGRRYQGRVDPGLTRRGEEQAVALGARLARELNERELARAEIEVHCSGCERALQTSALALPGVLPVVDDRLRELDFGAFDGRTYQENLDAHGERFRAWISDPTGVRPPGGETLVELCSRTSSWLASLASQPCVIAFTHGGPMRALLSQLLEVPFAEVWELSIEPGDALRLSLPLRPGDRVRWPARLADEGGAE